MSFRKIAALDDARKLGELTAIENIGINAFPDLTADIPGTGPEKMVYNYLKSLVIRFQFQYHEESIDSTAFPEEVWIPDFMLPDYDTRIQVFGLYWHSLARKRTSDLRTMFYQLYSGRMIIERGIPLYPSGGGYSGKYVIWWEDEIYLDLGFLFARDLPELFSTERISGQPERYLLDRKEVERQIEGRRGAMVAARLKPKISPYEKRLRKLRSQMTDLTKTYPYLKTITE